MLVLRRSAFRLANSILMICCCYPVGFALVFLLTPLVVAISHAKFWIPARYEELERVERSILKKNVHVPFKMLKVAGLGTVYVPRTTVPTKEEEKKTLVLVHGFAAGNALWACVSGARGY